MASLIDLLKDVNGYTETVKRCDNCRYYKIGESPLQELPEQVCSRNADVHFKVQPYACCDRWTEKRRKMQMPERIG